MRMSIAGIAGLVLATILLGVFEGKGLGLVAIASGVSVSTSQHRPGCCRICHRGCACGDSCIDCSKSCTKGPGCACDE
jgi:hypothetical protein